MTLDRDAASKRALSDLPDGLDLDLGEVQELREGWFFPYRARNAEPIVGSQGVVVNKRTGRLLHLGSAFPVERDLEMYERGYHSEVYDLVIREVADLGKTLDLLEKLRLTVVEPEFESGQVWRVHVFSRERNSNSAFLQCRTCSGTRACTLSWKF